MCLGIPGEIIEMVPGQPMLARADVLGVKRTVNVGLVLEDGIARGDWVLIHVGFAMAKIDEDEARRTLGHLAEMDRALQEELEAMRAAGDA